MFDSSGAASLMKDVSFDALKTQSSLRRLTQSFWSLTCYVYRARATTPALRRLC